MKSGIGISSVNGGNVAYMQQEHEHEHEHEYEYEYGYGYEYGYEYHYQYEYEYEYEYKCEYANWGTAAGAVNLASKMIEIDDTSTFNIVNGSLIFIRISGAHAWPPW